MYKSLKERVYQVDSKEVLAVITLIYILVIRLMIDSRINTSLEV